NLDTQQRIEEFILLSSDVAASPLAMMLENTFYIRGNKDISRLICQEMDNANHIQELLRNCNIQEGELDLQNGGPQQLKLVHHLISREY
ncbi:25641_t:CDS:2, partial [Gigaspora rosea]